MNKLLVVVSFIFIPFCLTSQTYTEIKQLFASDFDANHLQVFGSSVAIDGDYVVIGSSEHGGDPNYFTDGIGSAYIFKKNQGGADAWTEIKQLFPTVSTIDTYYGHDVTISGDYIAIGAYSEDTPAGTNVGAVYLYKKDLGGIDNWGLLKKFTPAMISNNDNFSFSISIDGDHLAVVERRGNLYQGIIYIYQKDNGGTDNWGLVKTVTQAELGTDLNFLRVALSANTLAIGAPFDDYDELGNNFINNAGAVYILEKDLGGMDNWGISKKIVASDRSEIDWFGDAIDIDEDYLVVGAHRNQTNLQSLDTLLLAGAAYVFDRNGAGVDSWAEVKKLVAPDRAVEDLFGLSVAIDANHVVVGAPREDENEFEQVTISRAGSAYIFEKDRCGVDNWGLLHKIVQSDRAATQYGYDFGIDVAIDDEYIVGSTFWADGAYIFKNNSVDLIVKAYLQGPFNGTDMNVDLQGLIPTQEPFTGLGFTGLQNATVSTTFTTSLGEEVDWVMVSIRSTPTNVVAKRAALLRKDGRIVDVDGKSPLIFGNVDDGNYYVSVQHRNHLGVMTNLPVFLD